METRAEEIHRSIDERNVTIANGVSAETKDRLEQEIQALRQELEGMDTQELPVAEVVDPILATVDGLPLEVYTRNEDAAILIRCEVESIVEAITKAERLKFELRMGDMMNRNDVLSNELALVKEESENLRNANFSYQNSIENMGDEIRELTEENERYTQRDAQLVLERDQALLYRDNAVKQLEDIAFELEQNRIELNRNREVRALTEAERTAEQEAARERFMNSRVKVYNVRWEDEITRRRYLAERAEDGDTISYGCLEIGGYIEITEEEALAIQAMNKPVEIPQIDEVAEAELFQSEESTQSLDESEDSGEQREVAEVEPETWEQTVDRRLNALELKVNRSDIVIHELAS